MCGVTSQKDATLPERTGASLMNAIRRELVNLIIEWLWPRKQMIKFHWQSFAKLVVVKSVQLTV